MKPSTVLRLSVFAAAAMVFLPPGPELDDLAELIFGACQRTVEAEGDGIEGHPFPLHLEGPQKSGEAEGAVRPFIDPDGSGAAVFSFAVPKGASGTYTLQVTDISKTNCFFDRTLGTLVASVRL